MSNEADVRVSLCTMLCAAKSAIRMLEDGKCVQALRVLQEEVARTEARIGSSGKAIILKAMDAPTDCLASEQGKKRRANQPPVHPERDGWLKKQLHKDRRRPKREENMTAIVDYEALLRNAGMGVPTDEEIAVARSCACAVPENEPPKKEVECGDASCVDRAFADAGEPLAELLNKLNEPVECPCGNSLKVKADADNDWEVRIVGVVQFRCPKCGNVRTVPSDLWVSKE